MNQPSEWTFDTYSDYRRALQDILSLARQTVAIFDPDLSESGLESTAGLALLESACLCSPHRDGLRFLLHETDFVERNCPRLLRLLANNSHRSGLRITDSSSRTWSQPFLIVDGEHLVTRFHSDLPRGRAHCGNPGATVLLTTQFETMWSRGENRAIGAPLGL